MAQDSKSRKLDQYIVRFPDGMRDRIKSIAERNNRSMNAEIIALILDGFEQRDHLEWVHQQHVSAQEEYELDSARMQYEQELQEEYEQERKSKTEMRELRSEIAESAKALNTMLSDLKGIVDELSSQNRFISDEYLAGKTDDINQNEHTPYQPQTGIGKLIAQQVERRTQVAMEAIIKELDMKGMLVKPEPKLSSDEWAELRAAPRSAQPDILAALADGDAFRALDIARKRQKKAG